MLASIPCRPDRWSRSPTPSVVVARSLERRICRSARRAARNPYDVPASAILTGVDGVERVFGNAVVERGPWLASVGIPTSVAMSRVPIFSAISPSPSRDGRHLASDVDVRPALADAFDHLDATASASAAAICRSSAKPMPTAEMDRLQGTVGSMITSLQRRARSIAAQVAEERRMREELQSLQRQVIRQERLAAIGVLVSGVAHELNNPLQAILGFAELLQMQQDMPEHARADLP